MEIGNVLRGTMQGVYGNTMSSHVLNRDVTILDVCGTRVTSEGSHNCDVTILDVCDMAKVSQL